MLQLLCILAALVAGYRFKKLPVSIFILNKALVFFIILILFVLGYNLGSDPQFFSQILLTLKIITIFSIVLLLSNFIFMSAYSKIIHVNGLKNSNSNSQKLKTNIHILESAKYLCYIILGVISGYFLKFKITHLELLINFILLIILFIIGFQLRHQNISLKTVLLNKLGIKISVLIVFSSLIAGVISAEILGLGLKIGLVLSSGLGWYTLSGVLAGQLISAHIGAAAFFIDFLREIIAILLIPFFGRVNPLFCIGYSASTALDFTLPILKVHLNEEYVSAAITSGLILTTIVPVLIPLFCKLA